MSHLLAFLLCLTAFAALAFAMHRHQRDIFGKSLPLTTIYALRTAGACALLLALAILVDHHGWSLGLVIFSGHTSIAAAAVVSALIGYTRTYRRHGSVRP